MKNAVENYKKALSGIQSRVVPARIESEMIFLSTQRQQLKNIAKVLVSGPQELTVLPYLQEYTRPIEKSLSQGPLSCKITNLDTHLKVTFAHLDQRIRDEYTRLAKSKAEETKIHIREVRRHTLRTSSDQSNRFKKILQEYTDMYVEQTDDLLKTKLKELEL
jgi:ribosome recycling factor